MEDASGETIRGEEDMCRDGEPGELPRGVGETARGAVEGCTLVLSSFVLPKGQMRRLPV